MMHIVHAQQDIPPSWTKSVCLAGPCTGNTHTDSWREDALRHLVQGGYDGVVFVLGPSEHAAVTDQQAQLDWEFKALHYADAIIYWVPSDAHVALDERLGVELGRWLNSHKLFVGHPANGRMASYLDKALLDFPRPAIRHDSLAAAIDAALKRIDAGAERFGGERKVPLQVWRTAFFRKWYENLKRAGHRLDDAKVRWVYFLPETEEVLAGVMWVNIWVEKEGRHKNNEWIFGRTDLCATVLYPKPNGGTHSFETLLDQEIVMVREFRPNSRSSDGFVHELPSGSSAGKTNLHPRQIAADEVKEETGLDLDASRLVEVQSRQAAATVSTHHVNLFMAALTLDEMAQATREAQTKATHGNKQESERTTVEIMTFRDLIESTLVDWSTVGMIMSALYKLAQASQTDTPLDTAALKNGDAAPPGPP